MTPEADRERAARNFVAFNESAAFCVRGLTAEEIDEVVLAHAGEPDITRRKIGILRTLRARSQRKLAT